MNKIGNYISASLNEFSKVVWPTRKQAIRLTLTVVIFSLVFASMLGLLDTGFRTLLELFILKG
ncbi:preprotein translocase subunit SecE [bacterium]|nr:preprotein translocase subunit SecE [bacterium]